MRQFHSSFPAREDLTHLDQEGKAVMVDVGLKPDTQRKAAAQARVFVGEVVFELIQRNALNKGDALTVAHLAGIMAAKSTSQLIPLCHNISLTEVTVRCGLDSESHEVVIASSASTYGKTGAEMEALVAASVAALTVYDMCKAVNRGIVIREVKLLSKTGGVRGDHKVDYL